ncbi:sensor histidine kinase [uncultured Robinsoniella sp.]|uniref:cache domain-containing sensor histidine kinase n=1 Tax=uncultured Robinsoniella sp. TaxID=904190 RepID=UPI00374EDDD3
MRVKILILCLGLTLFALILQTILFENSSSGLIYNQAKEESFASLQNMQNEIYGFVKNMESNMIEIYSEKDLIQGLKNKEEIEKLRTDYYRLAYNFGTSHFATTDGVVAMYLYNPRHEIISTYRRAVTPKHNYQTDIYEDPENQNANAVKDYVESDDTTMLISSYYNQYRETDIIRLVLKIYNNSNLNDVIGYAVCDIDSKVIRSIMEKYSTDKTMFMWLQPSGDRPAVSIGSLEGKDVDYYNEISAKIQTTSSGDVAKLLTTSKRVFFQVPQKKYNMDAYSLMPRSLLVQNQRALTKNLIFIALIMIIAATILTILVSRGLTKPLDKLMQTIERIKGGDTHLRVDIHNRDEVGILGQSFNEMLDQMEVLISQEYETKLLLNRAEYKALQAQINPHFLYNTLDTMSSIAQIQNCPEVSGLSQSLSNIFRYSLDMKNPFSTVAKEIVHLKNYIYVMNVRMRDNVKYTFDIDETVLQDTVPRISIQPLVENALNHGLRNTRGEKEIVVCAQVREGNLWISVQDNGVGMDAAKVNEILEKNDINLVEKGSSIGLNNINARMKMLYGKEYGIHVESEVGKGTRIYLKIPRVKMEEVSSWMQQPIKS